jgi:RecA-family ATPase
MNDSTRDTLPPHSNEAEQSVLGAIMLDNAVLDRVNGSLTREDFYSDAHRLIYAQAQALRGNGQAVDVTTLHAALDAAGQAEYVGGLAYLGALVENVPTATHAVHYAAIVRERAESRRVAALALEIHDAALYSCGLSPGDLNERMAVLLRNAEALNRPRWSLPGAITPAELAGARWTPDCIVENYLYADVGVIVAPGGTGKTTLLLYEKIHIALGMPLYGLEIRKPGPSLIVTAEDTREMLVARLRVMSEQMKLSPAAVATVMRDVRISDVCGTGFRLTRVVEDVVLPSPMVDVVIAECRDFHPVLVTADPAISFGVGESRVNDAEQGLVEAARRIRRELNCCVRYVHHTGKANASEKAVTQYAGRGGSAMPDGCRMVAVLQPLTPDEWKTATGAPILDGENGAVLARPKLSYAAPQPDILICRKGYGYTHTSRDESDAAGKLQADCDQVLRLLQHDLGKGIRHTQNSIEALGILNRARVRNAVATLIARRLVEHAAIPDRKKGGPQSYLQPIAAPNATGAP